MKKLIKMLALLLVVSILLTGCELADVFFEELDAVMGELGAIEVPGTPPADSEYLSFSQEFSSAFSSP